MNAPVSPFARLGNRRTVRLDQIPESAIESFRDAIVTAVDEGWRIVSLFGTPETATSVRLIVVVADDERGQLGAASTVVGDRYPSIAGVCAQASVFEREIAEQCGVIPEGHPRLAPLRRHPPDHRPSGWAAPVSFQRGAYPFSRLEGDEIHEVAVGPVHAGIIEPGHFRFQAHGEEVLSLEIMLGYQHRGVECLLEGRDPSRAMLVAESVAGDTVIAHANAYCGALEALARCHKSARAQSIRGIALELERLANHVGDLGALAGDVAYQPAAAFFGRLRGDCLNMLMTISGNRFGRGLIRPGGAAFDIPPEMAADLDARSRRLERELRPVAELFFGSASVQSRLEGVGVVTHAACIEHGFVGPVARACEVHRDVRHDHPFGVFRYAQIPVATAWGGDVYARALIRWIEIQRSLEFVREQLGTLPAGDARVTCDTLRPSELVVAMEEGWRGEVVHAVLTDEHGHVRRHKVTDPSLRNWAALALAMPGNQISDFPLCNKSFNLSYAGHDL
jgi:Ni,Fe-hydrogenase III large subunit/Ni,Fe-hydrogenase III component G